MAKDWADICIVMRSNIYKAEFDNDRYGTYPASVKFIEVSERKNRLPHITKNYPLRVTDDFDKEISIVLRIELSMFSSDYSAKLYLWFEGSYDGEPFQQISMEALHNLLKFPMFIQFVNNSISDYMEAWNTQSSVYVFAYKGQAGRDALDDSVYMDEFDTIYVGQEEHSQLKMLFPYGEKEMSEMKNTLTEDLETMVKAGG